MGTVLGLRSNDLDPALPALEKAKDGHVLSSTHK